jgi:hypothetical protein
VRDATLLPSPCPLPAREGMFDDAGVVSKAWRWG